METPIHLSQPLFSYPISFSLQLSFQCSTRFSYLITPSAAGRKPYHAHHKPCPAHRALIHFFFSEATLHLTSEKPQNDELRAAREAHWCVNNQNCSHPKHLAPAALGGANEIFRGWPLQIGMQRSHPPLAFNFLFSEFSSPISISVCDKYLSTLPARLATQGRSKLQSPRASGHSAS